MDVPPVPEIQLTPASPSASMESFETASSNIHEWDLTPYQFNCPRLSSSIVDASDKDLNEIASIRMPEYHLLVDHTLGVAWKSICNERKDIDKMTPDQLIWAIKLIESHRSQNSQYSEDMRLVLQYLQEIVVAFSTSGIFSTTDRSQLQEHPPATLDSSFVLANMTPKSPGEAPSSIVTPAAASTPLPAGPAQGTLASSMEELVKNLESLHLMLVQLKKSQLRRIDIDTEHLEAIERLLCLMAAEDLNQSGHQLQIHGKAGNDISQSRSSRPESVPANGGGRRRSSSRSGEVLEDHHIYESNR